MAKFSHLSRNRYRAHVGSKSLPRCSPTPQEVEQSDRDSVIGVPPERTDDAVAEAEYFLQRVEGSCACKAAYQSRCEVSAFLRQTGHPGSSYKCQFCAFWHITSMTKRDQKDLIRRIRAAKKLIEDSIAPLQ